MEEIINRITEIAKENCFDYPDIESVSVFEKLWAIECNLKGTNQAIEDWKKLVEKIQIKTGLTTEDVLAISDEIRNKEREDEKLLKIARGKVLGGLK